MNYSIFRKYMIALFLLIGGELSAQTLTLQECRDKAVAHDEELQKADISVRQAELERKNAFANYLPKLDGTATMIYRDDIGIHDLDLQLRGALVAGLTLTQPLYQGGKIRAANKLARISEGASQEKLRKTKADLIYEVDNTYYTLVGINAKVKMLEAYLRQMEQLKEDVVLSVKNGLAIDNDLLRIENEMSQAQLHLTQAKNGQQICQLALGMLVGSEIGQGVEPADTFDISGLENQHTGIEALSGSIENRPELALLKYQVDAARQKVKIAQSGMLPSLGLQAGYAGFTNVKLKGQLQTLTGDVVNLSQNIHKSSPQVALALNVPLFHWGTEMRKKRSAKMDVQRAQLDLEKNSKKMDIELRQATLNLSTSDEMVETARKGLQQAEENRRVTRQRFLVKLATISGVLDSETRWQQSYASLIEALTQQRIYETDYLRVTGQLE